MEYVIPELSIVLGLFEYIIDCLYGGAIVWDVVVINIAEYSDGSF